MLVDNQCVEIEQEQIIDKDIVYDEMKQRKDNNVTPHKIHDLTSSEKLKGQTTKQEADALSESPSPLGVDPFSSKILSLELENEASIQLKAAYGLENSSIELRGNG